MNIFATSLCPSQCAKMLDDKRVVQMVLETAQLLSTALQVRGASAPYKAVNINHPCSKWTRKTRKNYLWLVDHFKALCKEYTARFKKTHNCERYISYFIAQRDWILDGILTKHANGTTFKDIKDVHMAYRLYLNDKWNNDKRQPKWYGEI